MNYLDENGLIYLWSKIQSAVAAVSNEIPTKVSELTNDSGFTSNLGTITGINVNGTNIANSGVANITVPTKTSQLNNDSTYQTLAQIQALINEAVGDITGIDFQIVQSLPSTGSHGVIYLVPVSGGNNIYDEYIYVNNTFEKIGSTDIDLSGYVQFSDLTPISNSEIDSIVA